jgi:hypothetical protein
VADGASGVFVGIVVGEAGCGVLVNVAVDRGVWLAANVGGSAVGEETVVRDAVIVGASAAVLGISEAAADGGGSVAG